MTILPEEFKNRMKKMLGSEYEDFLASYDADKTVGIRVNTLKMPTDEFVSKAPFKLTKVKWCDIGFEAHTDEKCGRSALHDAGAFYMQELSAMAVAASLQSVIGLRGKKVLDLCAAPGGKSTQLAAYMQNEGLLVSNEINKDRASILSSNIERMGIRNCVVLNEAPESIAETFGEYFDAVVVDAPCSGEGMFRKDETAVKEWSPENVEMCARRQSDILEEAVKTVAPGGFLVYSTCTFAPAEDEQQIYDFLIRHEDFETVETPCFKFFEQGRPEWVENDDISRLSDCIKRSARLWPHRINGEGHFICILRRKAGENENINEKKIKNDLKKSFKTPDRRSSELIVKFIIENLKDFNYNSERFACFADSVYMVPEMFGVSSKGIRFVRCGLHLGELKKDRFEPSHSFAMALSPHNAIRSIELNEEEALRYRHGEEIRKDCENGWTLVCFEGVSLGWGKTVNGTVKNHYPKGLRIKY